MMRSENLNTKEMIININPFYRWHTVPYEINRYVENCF